MTEELIKEQLSIHYLGALLSMAGHKMITHSTDLGVDVLISQVKKFTFNNKIRILDSGKSIDVQLKCTTWKSVERIKANGRKIIKYDLNAQNYNDLIIRRRERTKSFVGSLILIIVVLDQEKLNWLSLTNNPSKTNYGLNFKGLAYWYLPSEGAEVTKNKRSKRIFIPENNVIDKDFLRDLFDRI